MPATENTIPPPDVDASPSGARPGAGGRWKVSTHPQPQPENYTCALCAAERRGTPGWRPLPDFPLCWPCAGAALKLLDAARALVRMLEDKK
jgi:hypothetical protein